MAAPKDTDAAKGIVRDIIADLSGRSGLGNIWEGCDRDVQREIRKEWESIALSWIRAIRDIP